MSVKTAAKNDVSLKSILRETALFKDLSEEEIQTCLECSKAERIIFEKGEMIFSEEDQPASLPMLISGSVTLGMDYSDGKRSIIAIFEDKGDFFGHELILIGESKYGMYAQAQTKSHILMIPKDFLVGTCKQNCGFHSTLISNMLLMMAQKSLTLNERLEIMSCSTLRQKIAKMILFSIGDRSSMSVSMSRQEMADFLNAARPSLSRELMRMQNDGLITVEGRMITVIDKNALEGILK
jgi:CRP-like cAMP-binding protein